GLLKPNFLGVMPTSEEGHYSLFGYDILKYKIKRGFVTAISSNIDLRPGDVAFRGNFAIIDDNLNILDRRAGRIKDTQDLIELLRSIEIDGVELFIESAGDYRLAIVFRGEGLSSDIGDGDPHYGGTIEVNALGESGEYTAKKVNEFLEEVKIVLKNQKANYVLLRGASEFVELPRFKAKSCCIAGKELYKGIAKSIGMDVLNVSGADGTFNTNIEGKINKAIDSLKDYDFAFVHLKATDSLAEDGDYIRKKDFIERADISIGKLIDKDFLIVVTSDHSTCSIKKSHCSLPIPFLAYNSVLGVDSVSSFSEKECVNGKIGEINQVKLTDILF
ncbi:MAG: phosphoglycerate mutase, partial [Candidatus Pacebacteria bacterium]|nr:phosphoglycerate mutase [Candidatus Paceibacterota bacterium]